MDRTIGRALEKSFSTLSTLKASPKSLLCDIEREMNALGRSRRVFETLSNSLWRCIEGAWAAGAGLRELAPIVQYLACVIGDSKALLAVSSCLPSPAFVYECERPYYCDYCDCCEYCEYYSDLTHPRPPLDLAVSLGHDALVVTMVKRHGTGILRMRDQHLIQFAAATDDGGLFRALKTELRLCEWECVLTSPDGDYEQTPLSLACAVRNQGAAEALAEIPVPQQYTSSDGRGRLPLQVLCEPFFMVGSDFRASHKEVDERELALLVKLLLEAGGEAQLAHRDSRGRGVAHSAAGTQAETMKLVLRAGDRTLVDGRGTSLLHVACKHGNADVIELLLEEDPKVQLGLVNEKGDIPLHVACRAGHPKAIAICLEKMEANKVITALLDDWRVLKKIMHSADFHLLDLIIERIQQRHQDEKMHAIVCANTDWLRMWIYDYPTRGAEVLVRLMRARLVLEEHLEAFCRPEALDAVRSAYMRSRQKSARPVGQKRIRSNTAPEGGTPHTCKRSRG